ncbi:transmembrane protein 154 [Paramisgurnus dabryanus]|uniref:transmembrane protein 154 n=1 Tax=Paramisgurnus dabryanus TaxID=90735 RepID=UPI0031F4431B
MTLVLLLILALTAGWTGLVKCEEPENTEFLEVTTPVAGDKEDLETHEDATGSGDDTNQENKDLDHGPRLNTNDAEKDPTAETTEETDAEDLNLLIIIIPLALVLILISVIVCGVIVYRRRRTKAVAIEEDHYLDDEDHEKVPMPMFEDDIPSVMELEMEDLENWMTKGNCYGHDAVLTVPS